MTGRASFLARVFGPLLLIGYCQLTYTCAYACTHMYIYNYTCIHIYIYTRVHIYIYTYMGPPAVSQARIFQQPGFQDQVVVVNYVC